MSGSGSNQLEPMALAIMLPTAEKSTKGKRGKAKLVHRIRRRRLLLKIVQRCALEAK